MPVLNGVAVGGVQRAAVQEQIAAIDLDHDEVVLRERAALDIQAGVLGDTVIAHAHQRRALPLRVAAVVLDDAALEGEPAVLNVDDIVGGNTGVLRGILTHDRAGLCLAGVHDRHACGDRQCGLAFAGAAVEGEAVQVKGQIRGGNGDVLPGIRQHRHGCFSSGRIDSRLQRLVLDVVGFGDVNDLLDTVSVVSVLRGDEALSAVVLRHCRGKLTAGNGSVRLIPRLLAVVFPAISLNRTDTRSAGKRAAADGHGGSTGGIRAIHDGNSRAVRDGAVAGLAGNVTVAGGADRTACHIQSACTHLNAAGHAVNLTAADRHRTGLRMIDSGVLSRDHFAAADIDGGVLPQSSAIASDSKAFTVNLAAVDVDSNAGLRVVCTRAENGNGRGLTSDLAAVDIQDLLTVSNLVIRFGLSFHVHTVLVAGDLGSVLDSNTGHDVVKTAGDLDVHAVCRALHRQTLQRGRT